MSNSFLPFQDLPKQRKFLNNLKKRNPYYVIGTVGLVLNIVLYFVLSMAVDPYFANIFAAFFPVWIMILVVGYRKEHPRR